MSKTNASSNCYINVDELLSPIFTEWDELDQHVIDRLPQKGSGAAVSTLETKQKADALDTTRASSLNLLVSRIMFNAYRRILSIFIGKCVISF